MERLLAVPTISYMNEFEVENCHPWNGEELEAHLASITDMDSYAQCVLVIDELQTLFVDEVPSHISPVVRLYNMYQLFTNLSHQDIFATLLRCLRVVFCIPGVTDESYYTDIWHLFHQCETAMNCECGCMSISDIVDRIEQVLLKQHNDRISPFSVIWWDSGKESLVFWMPKEIMEDVTHLLGELPMKH